MTDLNDNPYARDERYVWFGFEGEFDPDEITRATGLTPSSTAMKGTKPRPRASTRTVSLWVIDSGLTPSDEFHEHLDDLLGRLRPAWDVLCVLGSLEAGPQMAGGLCVWCAPSASTHVSAREAVCESGGRRGFRRGHPRSQPRC